MGIHNRSTVASGRPVPRFSDFAWSPALSCVLLAGFYFQSYFLVGCSPRKSEIACPIALPARARRGVCPGICLVECYSNEEDRIFIIHMV